MPTPIAVSDRVCLFPNSSRAHQGGERLKLHVSSVFDILRGGVGQPVPVSFATCPARKALNVRSRERERESTEEVGVTEIETARDALGLRWIFRGGTAHTTESSTRS